MWQNADSQCQPDALCDINAGVRRVDCLRAGYPPIETTNTEESNAKILQVPEVRTEHDR